ncbi:MAG: response regulator [Oligoflexia bacterium]|nr:response regulator [Oligoflexia bacterium]
MVKDTRSKKTNPSTGEEDDENTTVFNDTDNDVENENAEKDDIRDNEETNESNDTAEDDLGIPKEKKKKKGKHKKTEDDEIKILVVDDSEYCRKSIIDILIKEGFNVVGDAGTAQEATVLIQTARPNVMILDLVMPDVSGIEFAKFVHDKFPLIGTIMISSIIHEHIILESIAVGVLDFIFKPFTHQQIIDSVCKVSLQIQRR